MPKNTQIDVPSLIREYSDKGIFIEILAEGYKVEGMGIAWRGYVYWKEDDEWQEEDCGCFYAWEDAFKAVLETINGYILNRNTNEQFRTKPPILPNRC